MEQPVKPDVVEAEPADTGDGSPDVTQANKLIRIASMTRAMLEEARQAPLDDGGRRRMATVHARSVEELKEVLSSDLEEEFSEIMVPLNDEDATESELRVAQAQLIGWLEGVFHGIQASLWSQQMSAQTQLAEMQKKALGRPAPQERDETSGLYL
jgi:hypothetical protein